MSLRRISLIVLLVLFAVNICDARSSQTEEELAVISGVVKDAAHKKKLAGTTVSVPGNNKKAGPAQQVRPVRLLA